MTKKEILEELKNSGLKSDEFIVVGDASIVCHGLKRNCDLIEIYSKKSVSLDKIKIIDNYIDRYDEIDGYSFEGEPVEPMSEDELLRFKNGLFDLSERIRRIAESLG